MTDQLRISDEVMTTALNGLIRARSDFSMAGVLSQQVASSVGHPRLGKELEQFANNWSATREKLSKAMEALEGQIRTTVETFEERDTTAAEAMRPSGASSPTSGSVPTAPTSSSGASSPSGAGAGSASVAPGSLAPAHGPEGSGGDALGPAGGSDTPVEAPDGGGGEGGNDPDLLPPGSEDEPTPPLPPTADQEGTPEPPVPPGSDRPGGPDAPPGSDGGLPLPGHGGSTPGLDTDLGSAGPLSGAGGGALDDAALTGAGGEGSPGLGEMPPMVPFGDGLGPLGEGAGGGDLGAPSEAGYDNAQSPAGSTDETGTSQPPGDDAQGSTEQAGVVAGGAALGGMAALGATGSAGASRTTEPERTLSDRDRVKEARRVLEELRRGRQNGGESS